MKSRSTERSPTSDFFVNLIAKAIGSAVAPNASKPRPRHKPPKGSGAHASKKGKKRIRPVVNTIGTGLQYIPQIISALLTILA